jgi:hypothetical protein
MTIIPRARTRWPAALWLVGTVLLATMLFHIAALAVTGGTWTGPVSLRKPATFAETGWLACWSVALIMPTLRMRAWQRAVVGTATAVFAVVETTIMAIQAWRGVPSHYNFTTPLDVALMRGGAGGTAAIFIVGVVVLLVAAARSTGTPAPMRLGVLGGGTVLLTACLVGLLMIVDNSGVYQGSIGVGFGRTGAYVGPDAATVGPQYLLLRPDTAGGDLVLPHAIGVHGLLLLAVPAVLLTRTSARHQPAVVAAAVAAVGVTMAVLLGHAFRQQPLAALDPGSLVLLGISGAALATSYLIIARVLIRARRR